MKNLKKNQLNATHNGYGQKKFRRDPTKIGFFGSSTKNTFPHKILLRALARSQTSGRYCTLVVRKVNLKKVSLKRQLPFWSGQWPSWRRKLPFSFFGSYKNRVGRDPGGPRSRWGGPRSSGPISNGTRLSRHPSRCRSQ